MATIIEAPKSNFVPHPEGTFIAVLRDTYIAERENPWKGQQRDKKDPSKGMDTRETITEIFMEFLTEHEVEVGGKMLPGYVRYVATASLAENANLRKFIKSWFPQLKDSDFDRFDADKLIGKGAYITVAHNESKGNIYANVIGAMQPPKGVTLPTIPSDFIRHQDKPQAAPVTNDPAAKYNTKESIAAGHSEDIAPAGPQQGVPAPEIDDLPW